MYQMIFLSLAHTGKQWEPVWEDAEKKLHQSQLYFFGILCSRSHGGKIVIEFHFRSHNLTYRMVKGMSKFKGKEGSVFL